jgi:hypothetical protein
MLDREDNAKRRQETIWRAFFPETISLEARIPARSVQYELPVKDAIVAMTLRRPRDMQEIIRQVYERTKESRKNFPDGPLILDAFDQYSIELRQSVENEYKLVFPAMEEILTRFAGNNTTIEKNTLVDLIGGVVGHDEDAIYKAALNLFEACILGAVKKNSGSNAVMFYYDFQNFIQLWKAATQFGFHRAFWHSLQLVSLRGRRRGL